MKTSKYIQLGFSMLFATGILINTPSLFRESKNMSLIADSMDYYNTRPDLYRNRYKPFIRRPPKVVYKIEATVNVRQSSKGQVKNISIDGIRLEGQGKNGSRQTYTHLVSPGDHTIEWTVVKDGKSQNYSESFSVDADDQSVKLNIDGSDLSQQ